MYAETMLASSPFQLPEEDHLVVEFLN